MLGLPVRQLLPMHWPAILAGLVYGWRSGAVIGAASPIVSYLISGMPRPAVLPSMTWNSPPTASSPATSSRCCSADASGRTRVGDRRALVFLAVMVFTGAITTSLPVYLQAAMVPGLVAAVAQVVLLPRSTLWVAHDWVGTDDAAGDVTSTRTRLQERRGVPRPRRASPPSCRSRSAGSRGRRVPAR